MRSLGSLGTFIILMSSLLLLTKAWSAEIVSNQLLPENMRGVEAIVTKIEQESLTLKPTNNEGAEINILRKDDGTLVVGDKVVLQDQSLRKIEESSTDSLSRGEQEGKEAGALPKSP